MGHDSSDGMGGDSSNPATETESVCAYILIRSLKRVVDLWVGFVNLLEAKKK